MEDERLDFNEFEKSFTIVMEVEDYRDPEKTVEVAVFIGYPEGHGLTTLQALHEFIHDDNDMDTLLAQLRHDDDASLMEAVFQHTVKGLN